MACTQRVAIIGCGAAGLCMLKHLTHSNGGGITRTLERFEAVGFEQQDQVGGTWVYYEDEVSKEKNDQPWQCNIYKNLRTNLPKHVMSFLNFPYPTTAPSFLHHTEVLAYLKDYASQFGLYQHIKFQTQVTLVEPCLTEGCPSSQPKWRVTYKKCHKSAEMEAKEESQLFDVVAVCNGHYSVPYSPTFPGEEEFRGRMFHSHYYRSPEDFSGKTVVCVGAKSSGIDIGIELCSVAKKVFLSHRDEPLTCELPSNMIQKPEIQKFTPDGVVFKNGDATTTTAAVELVDAVVVCTGYAYSFPFLHDRCNVSTDDNRVTPLYKHLVHMDFHNLFFPGLCFQLAPYPLLDMQAAFCSGVVLGRVSLPSAGEMQRDTEEEYAERLKSGLPKHHTHRMGQRQWQYNDEMADMCSIPRLPHQIKDIYNYVAERRGMYPMKYKAMSISYEDK